jgi:M6 family metalloprotease-like protein
MPAPFYGESFSFRQPDGSELRVRGWGDQHHAVFETLDGYTVVQDPVTRFFQYATVTRDGDDLRPTGVRPGIAAPRGLGLRPGLRTSRAAARARALAGGSLPRGLSRWERRRRLARRESVGQLAGLCLLVQFPDVLGAIPREEVEAFCNEPGYRSFGNNGSVYDYFLDNSAGKLQYTQVVAPYVMARHPRAYYTDESVAQPLRARELIKEALAHVLAQGLDLSRLSADDDGHVLALNVFFAGGRVNNWAGGLWPHLHHLLTPSKVAPGKAVYDYRIAEMGEELTLGAYVHENGHMLCDFPDLYDHGYEPRGTGRFCLMSAGAGADRRNPVQVCGYLKYRAGWTASLTRLVDGLDGQAAAGVNQFFIHARNESEYFLVENRHRDGRDSALPSSGLCVWHVDELGDNRNEQMTAAAHYECSLVQADGRFDLEHGVNDGDERDLFHGEAVDRFFDGAMPSSKWWDGTASRLDLYEIGPAGPTVSFRARL